MSLSLGEKLRQAREERGFTLSDVAEQTRISSLYLESIENDDYRILPGGIFNKGFVKSYAKFVGIAESEALADYSALLAANSNSEEENTLKVYKPEVLTDDRSGSSMIPTIIFAVVILGIMTAGILFLVNYLRQPAETPIVTANTKSNSNSATETPTETLPSSTGAPDMTTVKVEFKALSEPVSLTATSDGKTSSSTVAPGTITNFEPRESLKLSYSKSLANFVQLTINGRDIKLPAQPLVPRRNAIEFEINKLNLSQIWTTGAISIEVPVAAPVPSANGDIPVSATVPATPAVTTAATPPRATPAPKPSVTTNTATNAAPRGTPGRPETSPAAQPKPATNSKP